MKHELGKKRLNNIHVHAHWNIHATPSTVKDLKCKKKRTKGKNMKTKMKMKTMTVKKMTRNKRECERPLPKAVGLNCKATL